MNPRTVKRKPRLSGLSRSDLSTASSTTIVEANVAEKPSKPLPPPPSSLVLVFHQDGFNTMVAYADSAVHYHISVSMNCFIPSSFITVVRRMHDQGDFVSSFEMGISTQRATVNMHGTEKYMDSVLLRTGKPSDGRIWQWKWDEEPGSTIGWHRESPVRYCYVLDKAGRPSGPMVAAFVVCSPSSNHEGKPQPASLKIFPDGQHIIDHILTSVLVVERKRLTPSPMTMSPIFN
ncbi:hypothetical protein OH77DRAFT_1522129 [Trametes cingulata]|nr:hypothetical protein OH77DRAFT_1522129 [Trametes cingulata]